MYNQWRHEGSCFLLVNVAIGHGGMRTDRWVRQLHLMANAQADASRQKGSADLN